MPPLTDRYRMIKPLASGGMGAVWLAEHLALGTPVVVKLVHAELAKREDVCARFEREARIAAKLKSMNVVAVLDHGVGDDGVPFLVMEHLDGETLRARVRARGRLSLSETAVIVSAVCRALGRAHEAGLVHRDIKPENIFLARDGDAEIVKVLDFGVVKVPDAFGLDGVDPTATGALIGTPSYMSPEQAQGLKGVDFRSDLWSMALVTIECLTGQRVFTETSIGPLIKQIVVDPLRPPSQIAPTAALPAAVDVWAARALERDPQKRFASAAELAASFASIAGQPAVALASEHPPPPVASQPPKSIVVVVTPLDTDETVALPARGSGVDTGKSWIAATKARRWAVALALAGILAAAVVALLVSSR